MNKAKNELKALHDKSQKESSFALKQTGMNTEKNPPNIFLTLKKRNKSKSHLRKILTSSGQETSNETAILDNIRSYHSSLYKRCSNKSESDCLSYLTNLNLPKLSKLM